MRCEFVDCFGPPALCCGSFGALFAVSLTFAFFSGPNRSIESDNNKQARECTSLALFTFGVRCCILNRYIWTTCGAVICEKGGLGGGACGVSRYESLRVMAGISRSALCQLVVASE